MTRAPMNAVRDRKACNRATLEARMVNKTAGGITAKLVCCKLESNAIDNNATESCGSNERLGVRWHPLMLIDRRKPPAGRGLLILSRCLQARMHHRLSL